MSYILDALRKADQQRQRGAAPTLLTLQPSAIVRKRPAFLTYGLLAVALIGAGIVIGWLRPRPAEQAVPARPESVAARPPASILPESTREPVPAPSELATQPKPEAKLQNATRPTQAAPALSEMAPQPLPKSQNATQPARVAPAPSEMAQKPKPEPKSQLPARAKPQTDGPPRQADAAAPGRTAAPARPVETAAADAAGDQTVISMAELPLLVRQGLPAMTISVHAYSGNPAARLVGIDNKILREGEYLVPGLKLEQITPDGMIFDFKGYRFHRGVH